MTQAELSLVRPAMAAAVPVELAYAQKSAASAFALACQVSGLEDKEIYLALNIDAGTFSRTKKGEANFPLDKLALFCDVVGNRLFADWIAAQVRCSLVMMQTEAERRAIEAETALAKEREINKVLKDLIAGRAA